MTNLVSTNETQFVASLSPAVAAIEAAVGEIAGTSIAILLLGEVGTGKEVLGRRIHDLSPWHEGEFVRIACATVTPERFLEGISGNGAGFVAQPGTLFFDEVSELEAPCQRKLRYALPESTGDEHARLAGRIISTSTRNLDEEVRAGRLRSDLYYRLNSVCLRLPPLRERKCDIPVLAEHFLKLHAARLGKAQPELSAKSLEIFMNYSWPGNIRELESVAGRIVALNDQSFVLSELAGSNDSLSRPRPEAASPARSLKAVSRAASREAERDLILKALARTRWNRKRAAQELQVSYKSLLDKLKQIEYPEIDT